jgi:hypothetical protein
MYNYGAGYTERRAVMGTNTTSRLYDTLTGIRINVIQVQHFYFANHFPAAEKPLFFYWHRLCRPLVRRV